MSEQYRKNPEIMHNQEPKQEYQETINQPVLLKFTEFKEIKEVEVASILVWDSKSKSTKGISLSDAWWKTIDLGKNPAVRIPGKTNDEKRISSFINGMISKMGTFRGVFLAESPDSQKYTIVFASPMIWKEHCDSFRNPASGKELPLNSLVYGLIHNLIDCPLAKEIGTAVRELEELEKREKLTTPQEKRNFRLMAGKILFTKLSKLNIKKASDIPADLTITKAEIAPDLVAKENEIGKIEIPGIGKKEVQDTREGFGGKGFVTITTEEFHQITDWPFTNIDLMVIGVTGQPERNKDGTWHAATWYFNHWTSLLFQKGDNRWPEIKQEFLNRWEDADTRFNFPKEIVIGDPREIDPPLLPEPIVWSKNPLTGETKTAYPAYNSQCWNITWFENPEEAKTVDEQSRKKAETFVYTRKFFEQLYRDIEPQKMNMPELWNKQKITKEDVMDAAGIEDYFTRDGVGFWSSNYSWGGDFESDDGMRTIRELPIYDVQFAKTDDTGIWEIGEEAEKNQCRYFFEVDEWEFKNNYNLGYGTRAGSYKIRKIKPVLEEMGFTEKQIEKIRADIDEKYKNQRQEKFEKIKKFIQNLINQKETFPFLPPEMIERLRTTLTETPEMIESTRIYMYEGSETMHYSKKTFWGAMDDLPLAWARAKELGKRVRARKCLVEWGKNLPETQPSKNDRYYVIEPNGDLRDPDIVIPRKHFSSEKYWSVVGPEEVAVSYKVDRGTGQGVWKIDKKSVSGNTPEQNAAIEEIKSKK